MPDYIRSEPKATNITGPSVEQIREDRDNSERIITSRPRAILPNLVMFLGLVSD
jgi:hypothetical protein